MRHFHRTHIAPERVLDLADEYFPAIGMTKDGGDARRRSYRGALGSLALVVRPEGGHYTFVEAETDQVGESRLDRNVKRFFVKVHRMADPSHTLAAAY
ncbi:MAG TPA: hypothetical protein VJ596_05995 [Gemmatimonadaceae bacterium]|nr:hypothetical protein [Gemmatimonadaceae bacterium]